MKIITAFLFIVFLLPAAGRCQTERRPKYAPHKERHRNRTDELDRKQGLWKYYNYLGTLMWEIEFTDDKRNGLSKRYYYNGRVMRETEYVFGLKDGLFKRYDYDGNVRTEGEYDQGKKSGHWTNYFGNGQIRSEGPYEKGRKNGVWKYYSHRGPLINAITFVNGKDLRDIQAAEKKAEQAKKVAEAKARAKKLLEHKPLPTVSKGVGEKNPTPASR